jgi:anti-anti-sigma factor
MEIIDYRKGDILILGVKGNIDEITSEIFQKKLVEFIENGENKIIIDCNELDYISSGGIRAFYLASSLLEEKNGKIVFTSLNKNIKKLFDIVEMEDDFDIFPDLDMAIKKFL